LLDANESVVAQEIFANARTSRFADFRELQLVYSLFIKQDMDFRRLLEDLRAERECLNRLIADFEALAATRHDGRQSSNRRGRKSMPPQERALVSQRMRKYWAGRREKIKA
jgi:hypothetical protein